MEKEQAVQKREWGGWAKSLLIAGFVIAGINVLRFPLGYSSSDLELTLKLIELACIWGIWKFKRLAFYVFMALYLMLALIGLRAMASVSDVEILTTAFFVVVVGSGPRLILMSLIVRSRWTDMDPVKFPFRGTSAPQGE